MDKKEIKSNQNWSKIAMYIVPGLVLVLTVLLAVLLSLTQMLPTRYFLSICAVMLIFTVLVTVLTWKKRRVMFWSGVVLGIVMIILLIIGNIMLGRGLAALNAVTTPGTELTDMRIYVRTDDPAETLKDLANYTFGVLEALDRENSELCVTDIETQIDHEIRIQEYNTPVQLVDAVLNGDVGAIILNSAYLDVVSEIEGYEDIESRVREITQIMVNIETETNEPQAHSGDLEPFTVYISGIDSRMGLYTVSRSDVNIIATINPITRQMLLVSTPRDYFIPLSISNGARDKLTHAGIYGVQVSMDTLAMLYDTQIDYYFRIDFNGFENIIDNLGGINVYSDYEFTSKYHYMKGKNYLNGEQALSFARERYSFPDGDRQRGKNQMAVIRGVIQKAQSVEVLTNYMHLMDSVEGSFETSVPYELIAALVRDGLKLRGDWDVVTYSVSGADGNEVTWSQGVHAYVMWPDQQMVDIAKELMERVRAGENVEAP